MIRLKVTANVTEFGRFLSREMTRLGYNSLRSFAEKLNVSHTTLARQLSDNPPIPDREFLVKLAEISNIDMATLVLLAYGITDQEEMQIRLLVARIRRLPPDRRAIVQQFLDGELFQ